jgi:2-enoate reductase
MIEACDYLLGEPGSFRAAGMVIAPGAAKVDTKSDLAKKAPITSLLPPAQLGETVAVIGGGLTGCEIAYELYLQGKQPLIVEMLPDLICQKGVCLANSSYLREFFAWKKVPVYLETALSEVTEEGIIVKDKDGRETEIPCDSVISSAGYLPAPLAAQGRKEVYLVGDCRKVGNLRSVIWSAYETAMKI